MLTDYVARLEGEMREAPEGIMFTVDDHRVLFPDLSPSALREAVNRAMAFVAERFAVNVTSSGVAVATRQIEEAAIHVVLYWLSTYNLWRRTYAEHRDHPLTVTPADLDHPATFDRVWWYCKRISGDEYARYAAALLGLTIEEFARREAERERWANMW